MTSHDRVIAAKALHSLAKFFNRKPDLDEETIADYLDALEDLTFDAFEQAVRVCKRDGKWFPKPRDLRIAAADAQSAARTHWEPRRNEIGPDGEVTPVYACPRCLDTGWRPQCGCSLAALGILEKAGECPTHPRVVNERTYRQALTYCECRDRNPVFLGNLQRPEAPRADRQKGAA